MFGLSLTDDELGALFPVTPWPHQLRGVRRLMDHLENVQGCTLCAPTGGGKTKMMQAILGACDIAGKRTALYTNRRLLTKQIAEGFAEHGLQFGVFAASMPELRDDSQPHQIVSTQTVCSRGCIPEADVVLIDEAHLQLGPEAINIFQDHLSRGALIIPVSATPLGCKAIAPQIVVAGKNSELRACKAHVPAIVTGVHEMDVSEIRRVK